MWIERAISDRITRAATNFPAVLLTGARQTGKTSLLRHLFPTADYVSFDLPSTAAQAETSPQTFLDKHAEAVILDEIQYVPMLFRYLKDAVDHDRHKMGRFLLTGS